MLGDGVGGQVPVGQRPGVREQAREDMEVLERLATLADKRTDAGRTFGFGRLLDQFRRQGMVQLQRRDLTLLDPDALQRTAAGVEG